MADVQEYAARLSQAIGPRPAGTEEEQQASFFIDEVFREAGLEARTEEFRCNPNFRAPRVICCLFTVILGFLSILLNMLVLPAMLICLVTAVLFVLDCFELSPFANFGKKGLSQNIVAKYEPPVQNTGNNAAAAGGRAQRRRKIILVANYDSGKVRRELKAPTLGVLNIIRWVELGAMVLVPLALLIRLISGENSGPLVMFTNVLTIVGVIGALLVVLSFITSQIAAYNDGANCNASAVAVMMEVAKRISASRTAAPRNAVMHGAREAYEAGVVPDGAELIYADEADGEKGEDGAAGAAADAPDADAALPGSTIGIPAFGADGFDETAEGAQAEEAALTEKGEDGAVVEAASHVAADAADADADASASEGAAAAGEGVEVAAGAAAAAAATPAASAAAADPMASIFEPIKKEPDVPDWYKRAMSKASKPAASAPTDPSIRSKFSDALDAAVAASHPEPEPHPSGLSSDAEQRLQAMRETIMSGRPLSEATGTVGTAEEIEKAALESEEIETAAAEVEGLAAEPTPATHTQGVDGYLSSTMDSPSYEAAQADQAGKAAPAKKVISTGAQPAVTAEKAKKEPRKKRSIMLPSLTGALKPVSADDNAAAEASAAANDDAEVARIAERNSKKLKKANLASSLPSLDGNAEAGASAPAAATSTAAAAASAVDMSGATGALEPITPEERNAAAKSSTAPAAHGQMSPREEAQLLKAETQSGSADLGETISISQVGSFANAGMTGAFEPLGSDFVSDMTAEEVYIDDADDSGYGSNVTESGALAGPGYVEMPRSRRERMFGKFRRKNKKQEDVSFSEAMGIDEGYDARQVGKDRGGWESFRQGGHGDNAIDSNAWGDDDWNGGAFDVLGGAYGEEYDTRYAADMREGIRDFHEGPVQLEVWFVALGAELAGNAGMKSFIADHTNDLRGAMIVNIEALGAGELTMIEREGTYRTTSMSSRLKRYVHKAGEAIGIRVGTANMLWENSAAYVAERHGCQTLHLAGVKDGKPAYMAEADDVLANIDPQLMEENAMFLMELIRGI